MITGAAQTLSRNHQIDLVYRRDPSIFKPQRMVFAYNVHRYAQMTPLNCPLHCTLLIEDIPISLAYATYTDRMQKKGEAQTALRGRPWAFQLRKSLRAIKYHRYLFICKQRCMRDVFRRIYALLNAFKRTRIRGPVTIAMGEDFLERKGQFARERRDRPVPMKV